MKKAKNRIGDGKSATILLKPTVGVPNTIRKGTNSSLSRLR
jgi:hypothetical protein